ncbi:phage protein Gp36 family protein [Labilibaculum euxinus]
MKYINKEDLIAVIQERLMLESVAMSPGVELENNELLNNIEQKAIDFAISYISGKYDTEVIFKEETPVRNGVLVQVIASIVVYRSVRRNAARKVPEDYIQLYSDAKKDLERIQSGAMNLINCPKLTSIDGTSASPVYGNNTNDNFFI